MASPVDKENLRPVFNKIMLSHQLRPQDVKKERRRIDTCGYGAFECENCGNLWRSAFSWVKFDLIDLEISYRWKMKCQCCKKCNTPTFKVEQLEEMFENVVVYYKGEKEPRVIDIGSRGRREYRQPHRPDLCEKCNWGADDVCWRRRFYG